MHLLREYTGIMDNINTMSNIEERTINEAKYIISAKSTIRDSAKVFGMSKSTVHYDIHVRLPKIDELLYAETQKILDYNLGVRHLRGGASTKALYNRG